VLQFVSCFCVFSALERAENVTRRAENGKESRNKEEKREQKRRRLTEEEDDDDDERLAVFFFFFFFFFLLLLSRFHLSRDDDAPEREAKGLATQPGS